MKDRLKYFIVQTQELISKELAKSSRQKIEEIDFKSIYMNLYSFSSKLKFIGRDELGKELRIIAKNLIEKPTEIKKEIPSMLTRVLQLSTDIDSYIE